MLIETKRKPNARARERDMEAVDFIDFFKANLAKFTCAGGLDPNNDQIPSGPPEVTPSYSFNIKNSVHKLHAN